jgi:hypothetical protein
MPALDAGIHAVVPLHKFSRRLERIGRMDCRVKPGNDAVKNRSRK